MPRGGEHQRVDLAVGRRRHHDDALDAGDARRNRVHQDANSDRRRCRPARRGRPPRSPSSGCRARRRRVGVAVVGRHLAAVEGLDAVAGEEERVALARPTPPSRRRRSRRRRRAAGRASAPGGRTSPCTRSAPRRRAAHIVDDGARRRVDVLGDLALGGEERGEARLEIRCRTAKSCGHGAGSGLTAPLYPMRRFRLAVGDVVAGLGPCRPGGAEVGEARLDDLDVELRRRRRRRRPA